MIYGDGAFKDPRIWELADQWYSSIYRGLEGKPKGIK